MKLSRKLGFQIATVLLLIVIAAIMMIVGRGHTLYFDNKTFEYQGTTYSTPYRVDVDVDEKDNSTQKLYAKERGSAQIMGQSVTVNLEITEKKGGEKTNRTIDMKIPYSMDGVVINLPALLEGFGPEVYMSEYVIVFSEEPEEEVITDEFSMGDF